ncbi:putative glutamate carboxypeptidase 2-like protein [Corchorus capsularis]|uniref:Putative glutamate carboxypeptidase 2-like protein n=1 Tax=Corchorus capsularis TaxID=210143 RepID=A0A1R3IRC8_COCAP|nr:putative glutamate carboxypeptidase 2-like protein [Corchorus capsularis]
MADQNLPLHPSTVALREFMSAQKEAKEAKEAVRLAKAALDEAAAALLDGDDHPKIELKSREDLTMVKNLKQIYGFNGKVKISSPLPENVKSYLRSKAAELGIEVQD